MKSTFLCVLLGGLALGQTRGGGTMKWKDSKPLPVVTCAADEVKVTDKDGIVRCQTGETTRIEMHVVDQTEASKGWIAGICSVKEIGPPTCPKGSIIQWKSKQDCIFRCEAGRSMEESLDGDCAKGDEAGNVIWVPCAPLLIDRNSGSFKVESPEPQKEPKMSVLITLFSISSLGLMLVFAWIGYELNKLRLTIRVAVMRLEFTGENIVSRTAELSQATADLTAAVNNAVAHAGQSANSTPDADVDTSIAAINGVKDQLNTAFPTA